ncbi:MAG: fibronectin type III domain-containing protein [Elusimicrobia bacterium]|nr:fibronectin type III domain-containing protein [Elusimicrobiota bacterium]
MSRFVKCFLVVAVLAITSLITAEMLSAALNFKKRVVNNWADPANYIADIDYAASCGADAFLFPEFRPWDIAAIKNGGTDYFTPGLAYAHQKGMKVHFYMGFSKYCNDNWDTFKSSVPMQNAFLADLEWVLKTYPNLDGFEMEEPHAHDTADTDGGASWRAFCNDFFTKCKAIVAKYHPTDQPGTFMWAFNCGANSTGSVWAVGIDTVYINANKLFNAYHIQNSEISLDDFLYNITIWKARFPNLELYSCVFMTSSYLVGKCGYPDPGWELHPTCWSQVFFDEIKWAAANNHSVQIFVLSWLKTPASMWPNDTLPGATAGDKISSIWNVDTSSPSDITTLSTGTANSNSVVLNWKAVGDDGNIGKATEYDIRYANVNITESNWATATQCSNEPSPQISGTTETYKVQGLNAGTIYYFAIKVKDDATPANWSGLSNVVSKATTVPDTTPPTINITSPNTTVVTALVTISGTASDNIELKQVDVKVGLSGTYTTATGLSPWSTSVTLMSGLNTIYAQATDTSNNVKVATITVTYTPPPNVAPTLSWTNEPNYISDGLNPETGTTNTGFVYRVKYADADGDAPKTGYPRVHIKKGLSEITGSPFVMSTTDTSSYVTGRNYSLTKTLSAVGSDYSYYFEAQDINDGVAVGVATATINAPADVNAYIVTYSIKGNLQVYKSSSGISGVTLNLSGKASSSYTTGADGYYEFVDLVSGNYSVKPVSSNWRFWPSGMDYTGLSSDMAGQNYVGKPFSVTRAVSSKVQISSGMAVTPIGDNSSVDSEISVLVPKGAFSTTANLTLTSIEVPESDKASVKVVGYGVEIVNDKNIQPVKEITITINYDDEAVVSYDESKLTLGWYDENNQRWVALPTTIYPDDNKVVGKSNHLSKFALLESVATNGGIVKVYPSPFNPVKNVQGLTIEGLTAGAVVKIYTVGGVLVRELIESGNSGKVVWDGKNDGGKGIASGVYIGFIENSTGVKKVKIVVEK